VGDSYGSVQIFNASNGIGVAIKMPQQSFSSKLWSAMGDGRDAITALEFSQSGKLLFSGDASGTLNVCVRAPSAHT